MNDACFTERPWRPLTPAHQQMMNGRSYSSSPAMNSSSQGSSREASPSLYLNKTDVQRTPYRQSPSSRSMSNGYPTQPMNDFRALEHGYKVANPWPENLNGTWGGVPPQADPSYGFGNLSLADNSRIEERDNEVKVSLVDRSFIKDLWMKSRKILWDEPKCVLSLKKFGEIFTQKYNQSPNLDVLRKDLHEYITIKEDIKNAEILLVPVQVFARDMLILLNEAGGRMLLVNFESTYLNRFGVASRPANFGFANLPALVQSLGEFVSIKGKRIKRIIVLNREQVPELPSYNPPAPLPSQPDTKSNWNHFPCNPVPPPPLPQNIATPAPPPTPPCDQKCYNKDMYGSRLMMGLTPSPQQTYQATSPVIYSGSPVAPNASVVWGQVWSPQYSVIPPLSPAHYMLPTIPINWGNVPSPPLSNQSMFNDGDVRRGRAPVSIQTLEQLGKVAPPNPSELPSPELLTNNGDMAECLFADLDEGRSSLGSLDAGGCSSQAQSLAKKRLAPQFNSAPAQE